MFLNCVLIEIFSYLLSPLSGLPSSVWKYSVIFKPNRLLYFMFLFLSAAIACKQVMAEGNSKNASVICWPFKVHSQVFSILLNEDLLLAFTVISIFMSVWVCFGICFLWKKSWLEQYRELQTDILQLSILSKISQHKTPLPDNERNMIQCPLTWVYGNIFWRKHCRRSICTSVWEIYQLDFSSRIVLMIVLWQCATFLLGT